MTIDPRLIDADEKLLWSGRPSALRYAFKKSWSGFLFGLVFFGFSAFWIYGAATHGRNVEGWMGIPFWAFGVPFLIVGGVMVLSPLWHLFRGLRTTYVLTNRRALTTTPPPFAQRLSVPLAQIRFIDMRPTADGTGDIYFFKETVTGDSDGQSVRRDGFIAIADVARAEQLLRRAIERSVDTRREGASP